jgi:serine/threonine protein phosphatase PrpC
MKLTVYRQAFNTRPNGAVVYKGEDARPYVDDKLLFVADGLGGAAAIRHRKVVPDLFYRDRLPDALFKGVYREYDNEVFTDYVQDSFFELYAAKDLYATDIYSIKKSGYYASRIVAAILLHEMLYGEAHRPEKIFSTLSACESEETRSAFLTSLGREFKELIQTELKQIARNANLVYESRYMGLALLGSTLCATIYLERDDRVEAIYLTAGDSRPYVWSEKEGLRQVLADQEGKDGGMTNYIKANEDADFEICCDYFSFEKPCVLFNATDGCFDADCFVSQLAFEKLLLDSALASESLEAMSGYLTDFFVENGCHDDSSTIALKAFGFEGYEAFQKACGARMEVLRAEYLDRMEDLLNVDYVTEYDSLQHELPGLLNSLKESFSTERGVSDYCRKAVGAGKFSPHQQKLARIDAEIARENTARDCLKIRMGDVIKRYYVRLKKNLTREDIARGGKDFNKADKAEARRRIEEARYRAFIHTYCDRLKEMFPVMIELQEEIVKLGVPDSPEAYKDIDFRRGLGYKKDVTRVFSFWGDLKRKQGDAKKLLSLRRECTERSQALAENNMEGVYRLCDKLIGGVISVDSLDMEPLDRNELSALLTEMGQREETLRHLKGEEREAAFRESCRAYWERHFVDVIRVVLSDPQYVIDGELKRKARDILDGFQERIGDVAEKAERQRALFQKYEFNYSVYIGRY